MTPPRAVVQGLLELAGPCSWSVAAVRRWAKLRTPWGCLPRGVPQPGTVPDRVVQHALRRHGYVVTRQAVAAARRRWGWAAWTPELEAADGEERP